MPPEEEHSRVPQSVGENEAFQRLMQVGLGDPEARKELTGVLGLDRSQREPALHGFAQRLQLQNEPTLAAAIASLCDDEVATRAIAMLGREAGEKLDRTQSVLGQVLLVPKILIGMAIGGIIPIIAAFTLEEQLWMHFIEWTALPLVTTGAVLIGLVGGGLLVLRLRWSTVLLVSLLAAAIVLGCYCWGPDKVVRVVEFEGVAVPLEERYVFGRPRKDGAAWVKYRIEKVLVGKIGPPRIRVFHPGGALADRTPGVGQRAIIRVRESYKGYYTALGVHGPERNGHPPSR